MIKAFLSFFYVPYEWKYCDAKFELANLHLRNIIVLKKMYDYNF